jgi:hypothetical protein
VPLIDRKGWWPMAKITVYRVCERSAARWGEPRHAGGTCGHSDLAVAGRPT